MEKAPSKLEIITKYFTEFTSRQISQLAGLEDLYHEWNSKINVISRKDMDGLFEKHVLHSLSISACFEFPEGYEVLDMGTGGGFPGIPLAIFFPEARFLLVDSIGKKVKVVEAIAAATGLENVTTRHGRAEEIKDRKFDCVVSRAVAPLGELWTWSKPLLRKNKSGGGWPKGDGASKGIPENCTPNGLICLKGGDLSREIAESGCRPRMMEIHEIFPEDYFREKFLLYVPK